MTFLTYLISGISLGSVYAIIALGYTMVYGIAKMLNFAHGDVIMVGAYMAYCAMSYLNLPPVIAIIAAMVICTILGILIERLAYKAMNYASRLSDQDTSDTTHQAMNQKLHGIISLKRLA